MIESQLAQLEQLIQDLLKENQRIVTEREQLNNRIAELQKQVDSLEIKALEHDDKQQQVAAKISNLLSLLKPAQ